MLTLPIQAAAKPPRHKYSFEKNILIMILILEKLLRMNLIGKYLSGAQKTLHFPLQINLIKLN